MITLTKESGKKISILVSDITIVEELDTIIKVWFNQIGSTMNSVSVSKEHHTVEGITEEINCIKHTKQIK